MKRRLALGLLVSMILICILFSRSNVLSIRAATAVIVVPDDYSAIQEAINNAVPALAWNETYGGPGSDFALALVQAVDGGYVLAGRTYSFGAGSSDIWLVKTDGFGNHLWNKTYGGTRDDRTSSLIQTADGGYAVAGSTYSFGAGSSDIWLVKTDAFGNHLWNKTYGGTREDDPAHFLVQTGDGGYALAGRTYSFGAGSSDIWLVKTDEWGNHLWNKTYGGTNVDGLFAFVQTVDGGYALAGHTYSFGAGNYDFLLVKTDSAGNMIWNRTYGGANEDMAYALIQAGDGGYAIAGETDSFGAGSGDIWLVRTDAFGNHLWNKTYGGTNVDGLFAFVQTVDGGYALAGHTYSFGAGSCDAWLVKVSADGSHEWNETFGGIAEDFACRLVQTNDEGYMLAGSTKSYGAGSDDFWLVETERRGSTIIVPDDYLTIQEAVNHAADGDTVFVKTGTYYEHVVVNKTLSLKGESSNATVIDGNWTGVVINVTRNGVTISGLTVQRSGSIYWENAGIILDNVRNCRIVTNMITENPFAGIYLNNSYECAVVENQITGNGGVGITVGGGGSSTISTNNITGNGWSAITLNDFAENNTIRENNMNANNLVVNGHCINLYRSSNNSIIGNNIEDDDNGVRFEYWSNFNRVLENSITQITAAGIAIETYSDCNTISGNTITGGRFAVSISNSRHTEICANAIRQTYGSDIEAGVYLESAAYTKIYENEITDNWRSILVYASSPYVSVYGNNITNNEHGIAVARGGSSYFNVSENYVANNRAYGIVLTGLGGASNYATVARNLIVNNTIEGVGIGQGSSYNIVIQNNIVGNGYGIYIDLLGSSTQNTIFNNNIINNTQQVSIAPGSINLWDGGYPSGGNYWSDYAGVDVSSGPNQNETGSDGIGETAHVIDANNIDRYPLKGMFLDHEASSECHVQTICNSTLSDFQFNGTAIRFGVSGESGTAGFCRVCIPTALMNETYRVFVNGTEVLSNLLTCSNETHSYLYFDYTHSVQEVVIIPEFPSRLILPLFMIAMSAAVIVSIRKPTVNRKEDSS